MVGKGAARPFAVFSRLEKKKVVVLVSSLWSTRSKPAINSQSVLLLYVRVSTRLYPSPGGTSSSDSERLYISPRKGGVLAAVKAMISSIDTQPRKGSPEDKTKLNQANPV